MPQKNNYKIKVQDVTKEYDMFQTRADELKSFFSLNKKTPHFWALMGISFKVMPGETLGIIGVNGSGKSTISNIISGIIPQTTGYVNVRGSTSIVAIGAGLKKKLTGRENIRLKSLMQGLTNKQIDKMMPDIIKFADIGNFVDQPVKDYSSGMKSRLGFSIAVHINPDILIIDEALSVGDDTFYQKCLDYIERFKHEGKTIIFVSHNLHQVRLLCDKVAWINYGKLRDIGDTKKVTKEYQHFTKRFKAKSKHAKSKFEQQQRLIRQNFDINAYQRQITKKTQQRHPTDKQVPQKVNHVFHGSVVSETMSPMTKAMIYIMMVIIALLCLENISGVTMTQFIKNPTSVSKPTKTLVIPNNQGVGKGINNVKK